jgi:hypothetical protein
MTSYLFAVYSAQLCRIGGFKGKFSLTYCILWSVDAPCRMCLNGGKDVHTAILSSIRDLAKLFSSYNDEVLVRSHLACSFQYYIVDSCIKLVQ